MHISGVIQHLLGVILLEHTKERRHDWLVTCTYKIGEGGTEVNGRFLQMVMGYLDEHVMHLMRADVVYEPVYDAIMAIDGRQLTANEVPTFRRVPWNVHLGVVQKRDDHDIATEDEQRDQVVVQEGQKAVGCVEGADEEAHQGDARHGTGALKQVTSENRTEDVVMVHRTGLIPEAEVIEPGNAEAETEHNLGAGIGIGPLHRIEDLVLFIIGIELVMDGMRELPHIVRSQKEAMGNVTDDRI